MKMIDINKLIAGGVSVTTGLFREYKVEDTEYGPKETIGILVGNHVLPFNKFAPKGTKLADVKQPEWTKNQGICIACVVKPSYRVDGKYLRLEYDSIHPVEP